MVYRGEYAIEEIDSAMKFKEGFPMGPFETRRLHGRDTGSNRRGTGPPRGRSTDVLRYGGLPHSASAVRKGRYGRKADAGYYDYDERDEPQIPVDAGQGFDTLLVWAPIVNEAAKMVQNDVASVDDIDTGARLGGNWPVGPLEKADQIGLDVVVEKLTEVASRHEGHEQTRRDAPV